MERAQQITGAAAAALGGFLLLIALTGAAAAQGFGPPNSAQPPSIQEPGFQQPGFHAPQSGQNPGGRLGFNQPAAQFAPSMVGTWTSYKASQLGPVQQTDTFSQDGRYVSVAAWRQTGLIARVWGTYRASPAGQNQLTVQLQMQGYLPKEICVPKGMGAAPLCQPFPAPQPTATLTVTFTSPSWFQAITQGDPSDQMSLATRDPDPVLLQREVAPRQIVNLPEPAPLPRQERSAEPHPAPPPNQPPPYRSICDDSRYRSACEDSRNRSTCDDSRTRMICAIRGGRLVNPGGCLICAE